MINDLEKATQIEVLKNHNKFFISGDTDEFRLCNPSLLESYE